MSRLLGPFSVTRSSVSLRDCASAEKIAGAEIAVPAANAVADLKNSRRFIENLPKMHWEVFRKCHARIRRVAGSSEVIEIKQLIKMARKIASAGPAQLNCIQ